MVMVRRGREQELRNGEMFRERVVLGGTLETAEKTA